MLLVIHKFSCVSLISALLLCAGCAVQPGILAPRSGDEIVIAGQLVHTGVPVRLWIDPGGFDGYRAHRHDLPQEQAPRDKPDQVLRFGSMRRGLPEGLAGRIHTSGWTLSDVAEVIDTIVLHYDECGSSSRCFHILHDIRGLSCHFLLDVDGTIYQTLDVKERAWHAGVANDRSIGIEIAHFGAAATPEGADRYYTVEDGLARLDPAAVEGTSAEGTAGIPARDPLFSGEIHGQQLFQRDFTEAQYLALESLLITLCRTLQAIEPTVPRLPDGSVQDRLRCETEGQPVAGIVGHWHVGTHKVDPGPAFDWDRVENALHEAGLRPSPAGVPD